jgi:hypothetical protein
VEWNYAAPSGNPLPTFRDNVSVPFEGSRIPRFFYSWTSWPLKMGSIRCPETSVKDYHLTLCNSPQKSADVFFKTGRKCTSIRTIMFTLRYNSGPWHLPQLSSRFLDEVISPGVGKVCYTFAYLALRFCLMLNFLSCCLELITASTVMECF